MKSKLLVFFLSFCILTFSAYAEKRSFKNVVDDTFIASKLRLKFMNDKLVPAKDIKIKVLNGVVTLNGELTNQDEINRAIEISEKQKGVREVKAYLVLKEFGQLKNIPDRKGKSFSLFQNRSADKPKKQKKEELQEKDLGSDFDAKPVETSVTKATETDHVSTASSTSEPVKSDSTENQTQKTGKVSANSESASEEDFKEFE